MQIERVVVYFIEQQSLDSALERNERARPMFTLTDSNAPLPLVGDKLVFNEFSYRVTGRTFTYENDLLKVVVLVDL